MKNIIRIAKIELSQLFYSPVAWIVLLVFIVQSGWQYMGSLERMEQSQQMGTAMAGATERMFSGFRSLFPEMQKYLYLYIPLLTMGLISRETHSGSIKLLYSSPVKVSEIILGKYLAMMGYCLLLISVLLGLGVLSLFTINHLDFPFVLSGIIGLYLLVCAYSAIGLFMSSLTSYQVVAAISTLVVLAILNFVGGLWQDIDFVRDITYFLSISGRVEEPIGGLIGSNDMLYFLIVIVLFLGLAYLKLQSERETLSLVKKMARYVVFIFVMLILGYISSRPQFVLYKDMTADASRTLTKSSREILEKFDEPVVMTTYVNLLDELYAFGLPAYHNTNREHFEQYLRYMPYMKMNYVYYWDHSTNEKLYKDNPGMSDEEIARKMAKIQRLPFELFMRPEQIHQVIDLAPEWNRLVRTLSYKGKTVFLRMFDDLIKYPAERETSAAFKRLIAEVPQIGFVTGHNERSILRSGDRDYAVSTNEVAFRYSLVNQGFDVKNVDLKQAPVDTGIHTLVIADPLKAFDPLELDRLKQYIDRGDNLLLAGEPTNYEAVNPLFDLVGVNMEKGILVQQSEQFDADFVLSGVARKDWIETIGASDFLKRDSAFVTTPGAGALTFRAKDGFSALPLLVTQAANAWLLPDVTVDRNTTLVDTRKNEEKKSYATALALTRTGNRKEQRIVVMGDADFMGNGEVSRQAPRVANFSVVTELFKWFSYGEFPIDTTRPERKDVGVLVNSEQIGWIRWSWMLFLPVLIGTSVMTFLLRRKRR